MDDEMNGNGVINHPDVEAEVINNHHGEANGVVMNNHHHHHVQANGVNNHQEIAVAQVNEGIVEGMTLHLYHPNNHHHVHYNLHYHALLVDLEQRLVEFPLEDIDIELSLYDINDVPPQNLFVYRYNHHNQEPMEVQEEDERMMIDEGGGLVHKYLCVHLHTHTYRFSRLSYYRPVMDFNNHQIEERFPVYDNHHHQHIHHHIPITYNLYHRHAHYNIHFHAMEFDLQQNLVEFPTQVSLEMELFAIPDVPPDNVAHFDYTHTTIVEPASSSEAALLLQEEEEDQNGIMQVIGAVTHSYLHTHHHIHRLPYTRMSYYQPPDMDVVERIIEERFDPQDQHLHQYNHYHRALNP